MHIEKRHAWVSAIVFLSVALAVDALGGGDTIATQINNDNMLNIANRLIGAIGAGISASILVASAYKRVLWRYDPFLDLPVLKDHYSGTIEYESVSGEIRAIPVDIRINQTIESVEITLFSNSSQSVVKTGRFVREGGEWVLYYVYNVSPLTVGSQNGGVRLGAAQLRPNVNNQLEGEYWTSASRVGRLYFYRTRLLSSPDTTRTPQTIASTHHTIGHTGFYISDECLLNNVRILLKMVSDRAGSDFSGTGIIIRNESFDEKFLISLRNDAEVIPSVNAFSSEGVGFLLSIARHSSRHHDGFCLVSPDGKLEKTSQYLFPPHDTKVAPDTERGTRSYSALCGSAINGILCIGIVSEDGSCAIYKDGKQIFDSRNELINCCPSV